MNFTHTELLSDSDLFNIFGGQDPNKPHGILQWIGYGIGAAVDYAGRAINELSKHTEGAATIAL